jgi:putative methionine-R-sulfoxide reductase with GAF domain
VENDFKGKPRYVPDAEKTTIWVLLERSSARRAMLSMPIQSDRKTVGCMHIHSQEKNRFCSEDLDMLQIVARQLERPLRTQDKPRR